MKLVPRLPPSSPAAPPASAKRRRACSPAHGVQRGDLRHERGEGRGGRDGRSAASSAASTSPPRSSVDAGLDAARAAHGVERILVNCAGIVLGRRTVTKDRDTGALKAHDLASFRKVVEVNLDRHLPHDRQMRGRRWPPSRRSTRTASAASSSRPPPSPPPTARSARPPIRPRRAGVLGITLPVARDLMGSGIRVCAIQPGIFWTPMFDADRARIPRLARRERAVPETPRHAGGICRPRPLHLRERLHQRRIDPPRRRGAARAEVTHGQRGLAPGNFFLTVFGKVPLTTSVRGEEDAGGRHFGAEEWNCTRYFDPRARLRDLGAGRPARGPRMGPLGPRRRRGRDAAVGLGPSGRRKGGASRPEDAGKGQVEEGLKATPASVILGRRFSGDPTTH